jgi:hypothetical protein
MSAVTAYDERETGPSNGDRAAGLLVMWQGQHSRCVVGTDFRPCVASFWVLGCKVHESRPIGRDPGMLTWLTRSWRFRAALTLAALYTVCLVTPTMALATGWGAAHCLTENNHGLAHVHDKGKAHSHSGLHEQGTEHEHSGDLGSATEYEKQTTDAASCCGLFCFSAVTNDFTSLGAQYLVASRLAPRLDGRLAPCGPDRLNRPPIV